MWGTSKGIGNIWTVIPRKPNSILVGLLTTIQRIFWCPFKIYLRMMVTIWRTQFYGALSALLLIFVRSNLHRVYLLLPQITVLGLQGYPEPKHLTIWLCTFVEVHNSLLPLGRTMGRGGGKNSTNQTYTAGLHCRPIQDNIHSHWIDEVNNLGYDRRLIYKQPCQDLGLCGFHSRVVSPKFI